MTMEKNVYFSAICAENHYQFEQLLDHTFFEDMYVLTSGKQKYIAVSELIYNDFPDLNALYFNIKYHAGLLYPVDYAILDDPLNVRKRLISIYTPGAIEGCQRGSHDLPFESKLEILKQLKELLISLHQQKQALYGFDLRQIYYRKPQVWLRYQSSKEAFAHNSVYKVIPTKTEGLAGSFCDFFSLFALTFHWTFDHHPFNGTATYFTEDEEQFYNLYVTNGIFIFDEDNPINSLGSHIAYNDFKNSWYELSADVRNAYISVFKLQDEGEEALIKKYELVLEAFQTMKKIGS